MPWQGLGTSAQSAALGTLGQASAVMATAAGASGHRKLASKPGGVGVGVGRGWRDAGRHQPGVWVMQWGQASGGEQRGECR